MVRKVTVILIICLFICGAFCATVTADSHTIYDGAMSSTYITYFRDIASNIGINDNYVCFRSGQYEYTMVVGDIDYFMGVFSMSDSGTSYTITNNSNYNSYYSYEVSTIDSFELTTGNYLLYSDLGNYPQLIERGTHYEFQTLFIIIVIGLCMFVHTIFSFTYRSRGRSID